MSNIKKVLTHLSSLPSDLKGRTFESYCKWFLENDPSYALQIKKVWLWKDWPDNWGRDKGIDLIAQTHCGKIWAIQTKAYDIDYYVTKEDVDTFLSESSRKIISFRLLIATTNNIGANAQEVIKGQEKPVSLCLLEQLESSDVDWSSLSTFSSNAAKKEIRKPLPHQQQAIEEILAGLQKSTYGQVYMACGTGKTLVGLWLAEKLHSHTTLVLVPSISLVSQLYTQWACNRSEKYNFYPIFICSDETVGDNEEETDIFLEKASDLGFPVTTNAEELLQEIAFATGPKVVFSTYHSSGVIKEACALSNSLIFDLAIADEAHRCAGKANSEFAVIVDKTAIRTKYKIFMTATPKIFSEHVKQTTKELEYEIVSMDDGEKFGPVFHKLPFSKAIEQGLLSDYQVIIPIMDNKIYQEYAERGRFVAIGDYETDARTLASQLLIAKTIKQNDLKKVITFHNRKKNAQQFVEDFSIAQGLLPINERPVINFKNIILGEMSQADRLRILSRFKESNEDCSLLGSVKCLSEGVDVPALDGIAFIDPKSSEIDIVQAVGRAIRKAPDKKIGTIIIPVFVDHASNEIITLDQSCFKIVWQVLRALRSHDDILAEELDGIRLELGKRTYKNLPKLSKITIDVPIGIGLDFGNALKIKLIENIVEHCSSVWNYQFGLLKEFREIYPHLWPTQHQEFPDGNKIGRWCSDQRKYKNKKILEDWKIEKLISIGFSFNPWDDEWNRQLLTLRNFRTSNPLRWPKKGEEFPQGNKLAVWLGKQNHDYKIGKLSSDKAEILRTLGYKLDAFRMRWLSQFDYLKNYMELYPQKWPKCDEKFPKGNRLGAWLAKQREGFRNGTLENWKIEFLSSINLYWDPLQDEWNKQFSSLKNYRQCNPTEWPSATSLDYMELAIWCNKQRQAFKKRKLNSTKIEKLKSIAFVWDAFEEQWNKQFNYLISFREKYPDRWLAQREEFPSGNKLGSWCSDQLKKIRKNQLSSDKKEKLESIGFFIKKTRNLNNKINLR